MTQIGGNVDTGGGNVAGRDRTTAEGGRSDNYISFNVGDKSAQEIASIIAQFPEIREIVFGSRTGLERWDGVVREVRELQKHLHELVKAMGELRGELKEVKRYSVKAMGELRGELKEVKRYSKEGGIDSRLLWAILIMMGLIVLLILVGIGVIRRHGVDLPPVSLSVYSQFLDYL